MNNSEMRSLIDSVYKARLANDSEACLAHFSEDAGFRIAGSQDASPIAGAAASVRQTISELVATWVWKSQEIRSITIEGNRAAIHFALETVFAPTGALLRTELLDLVTVEAGKIVSLLEFVDTAHVGQVVAAKR
jgi:ketosteroid isomerase-like protein